MSKLTHAQIIAARLWFAGGPKRTPKQIKTQAQRFDITEAEVLEILKRPEYVKAVRALMISTRSPRNIIEWLLNYAPKKFGEHMGLSEDVAAALMDAVRSEAYLEQQYE